MKKQLVIVLILSLLLCAMPALAEGWTCSNCGKEAEGNFCPWCGQKHVIEVTCPACGATYDAELGYAFCQACGAALPMAVPAEPEDGEIADTWDQILMSIDDGTARQRYAVGAWKLLDLGEFGTIRMQLAGFELDERVDGQGKAATTWIALDLLETKVRFNPNHSEGQIGTGTVGGWGSSELRRWLGEQVEPVIPGGLRERLLTVIKTQSAYTAEGDGETQTTADALWIPSRAEVIGNDALYYGLFRNNQNGLRARTRRGFKTWWWLRSANKVNYADSIADDGGDDYDSVGNISGGVALGFCL